MAHPDLPTRTFLRKLRRRLVVMRCLEAIALGAVAGAAASLPLSAALIALNRPAMPSLGMLVLAGAAAGWLWGWTHRPTPLAAALEADRQLGLNELLSTAWELEGHNAMEQSVLAQAAAVAGRYCPADVAVRRLGGRAWGAIGICLVLAGGLAIWSADPLEMPPSAAGVGMRSAAPDSEWARPIISVVPAGGGALATDHPGVDPETSSGLESETAPSAVTPSRAGAGGGATAGGAGSGSGSAQTDDRRGASSTASGSPGGPRPSDGSGDTSAGSAAGSAAEGTSGLSGRTGSARPATPVPVWQSADWPELRRQALSRVAEGQVPAAHEELMRRYFERE